MVSVWTRYNWTFSSSDSRAIYLLKWAKSSNSVLFVLWSRGRDPHRLEGKRSFWSSGEKRIQYVASEVDWWRLTFDRFRLPEDYSVYSLNSRLSFVYVIIHKHRVNKCSILKCLPLLHLKEWILISIYLIGSVPSIFLMAFFKIHFKFNIGRRGATAKLT